MIVVQCLDTGEGFDSFKQDSMVGLPTMVIPPPVPPEHRRQALRRGGNPTDCWMLNAHHSTSIVHGLLFKKLKNDRPRMRPDGSRIRNWGIIP